MKKIVSFFLSVVLVGNNRRKLLAGSLAVFLLVFLISPIQVSRVSCRTISRRAKPRMIPHKAKPDPRASTITRESLPVPVL